MRLFAPTCLAALCTTVQPALAELSVDDAWATWKAQFTANGLQIEAGETRDGDALQIGEIRLTFPFPMATGSAYASFAGPRFEPAGEGQVAVILPESGHITMGGEITGEGSLALVLESQVTGGSGMMSGQPGEVTSEWRYDGWSFELVDLAVSGEAVPEVSGRFQAGPTTLRRLTRIDDTHVTIETRTAYSAYDMSYGFAFPAADETVAKMAATGRAENVVNETLVVLPKGGIDVLGLHAQLRDGLRAQIHATTPFTRTEQTTITVAEKGVLPMTQITEMHDYDITMALGAGGLDYSGSTGAFSARGQTPELPFAFDLSGSAVDFRMLIPLLMGEDQDARLRMALHGLTMGESVWSLFDPEQELPREPATLSFDLASQVSVLFEFLDIRALIGGAQPPDLPVMAKTARLSGLHLAGAGAELTGEGAITLDYSDFESFDGIPAPDGTASFSLTGAHALLDKLVAMGLVKEEDALGARVMLSMVTKPEGDPDALRSEIEVKKTGELVVNGVRLR